MPAVSRTASIRFDHFAVDVRSGELRKHGLRIKLQPQPFQILVMLLEHPGEVVTREELQHRVWPSDTFVDFDVGLNSAIKKLREALQDSAEHPKYVETLPRLGYRFIGSIDSNEEPPRDELTPPKQSVPDPVENTRITLPRTRIRVVSFALAALTAACVGWSVRGEFNKARQNSSITSPSSRIDSIAVLPLEDLTGDTGQDYFAEGMTEALINDVAQMRSLKVISRTSVMRYKGTKKSLPEIGRELNVQGIVEGTVVRSGGVVRIDARLIETSTDRLLWAGSYERDVGNVIALQKEVAHAVAEGIEVRLTPEQQANLQRVEAVDPQTYELYLKGRYFLNQQNDKAIRTAIDYFRRAIQRSPNYSFAYAGLADAYILRNDVPFKEEFSIAEAAARRALELDDNLAEAHTALAACLFWYDWDWPNAEKEFQRALALNPNYAQAHQWYGQFQKAMGRRNWADEVKRARELDPMSLMVAGGGWYLESGEYDLAIEVAREKMDLYPNAPAPYALLSRAYIRKKMYREAIANARKSVALSSGEPAYQRGLAYAYAVSGNKKQALRILRRLALLSGRRYVSAYEIAGIYAGLNEKDRAFRWLDRAIAERASALVFLKSTTAVEMDNLRSDPRYAEVERRVGLPL